MITGKTLIENERREQIEKHGFNLQRDYESYENGELVQAAQFCEEQANKEPGDKEKYCWPEDWAKSFEFKLRNKNKIGKLTVAGAFYQSEFDRTGDEKWLKEVKRLGRQIDLLIK